MTLPKGWVDATVEEFLAPEPRAITDGPFGSALKSSDYTPEGVRVIRLSNVGAKTFLPYDEAFVSYAKFDQLRAHEARPGDLITAALGDPLGRTCLVPDEINPAIVKADCFRIRLSPELDKKFILSTMNSPHVRKYFIGRARGIGRVRINLDILRSTTLPLPPIAEQRRIVAKLDALSARLARARAELDRISVLAQALRQSTLSETFGITIQPSWQNLDDVLVAIEAGKNLKCDERPPKTDELGVVKVSAVSSETFKPQEAKTLPVAYVPPERDLIENGDLLIARASGSLGLVGRIAIVRQRPGNLYLSDKVLRLRTRPGLESWVHWFLRSPIGRSQIEDAASGISMHNITQTSLRSIKLPMPDNSARIQAISRLEIAFTRADRLESEAARAHALLDRLESAILAKAFRGELVPQDPNDEPASVLLERIRAQRAAAPKPKRGRRTAAAEA